MKPKSIRRVPVWIVVGVIGAICVLAWLRLDFFERLERMTFDMRVRWALRAPLPTATNLGFVYIDEATIAAVRNRSFGYSFGLYWPRQVYGRLVQELATQGAQATAFDVIFAELRVDHPPVQMRDGGLMQSDEFFAQQVRLAGNVVIAVTHDVSPPPLFLTNAAAVGDISTDKDSDGILRRARVFRAYRAWHPAFQQLAEDPDFGVDLREARIGAREIVLPRGEEDPIRIPLDEHGEFELADFVGEKLPPGVPARARPFEDRRVWHMGVVVAARALGLDLESAEVNLEGGRVRLRGPGRVVRDIPVDRGGYFFIDWCLPPNHANLSQQPAHALLRQNHLRMSGQTNGLADFWKGKLAIVGSSAMGNDLTDRGATPLGRNSLLVSKHWNVANSIITGRFVRRAPLGVELGLIVAMGLAAALVTWRCRAVTATGLVAVMGAAYVVLGVALYVITRYWIPLVLPVMLALLMTHVGLVIWLVIFEQADKRRVKSVFSTLVSPKIVNELLRSEKLALGGARREITVMFADVRGFTELTDLSREKAAEFVRDRRLEGVEAEAVFDLEARATLDTVNQYLGVVADTVIHHDGTLDKFIGDCVMAFWGAPSANPRHALSCVQAAIAAQRAVRDLNRDRVAENARTEEENQTRTAAGLPAQPLLPILSLGTGINTGSAIAGLMGAGAQAAVRQGSYTVFGREVNLAQRLETLSGHGRIYISQATWEHVRRDDPALASACKPLPPVNLRGIRDEVRVYEVPWLEEAPFPSGDSPTVKEATDPAPGATAQA